MADLAFTPRFMIPRAAPTITDPGEADRLARFADNIEEILAGHQDAVRIIRGRIELSDIGRQKAAEAPASKAAASVIAAAAVMGRPLKDAIATDERAILGPAARLSFPPGVNADDWRAAEREAREKFDALEEYMRRARYLEACDAGDRQTVRAFENAPSAFPLVSEDTLREGAERFAAAAYPAEYSLLSDRRAALDGMRYAVAVATTFFTERGVTVTGMQAAKAYLTGQPAPAEGEDDGAAAA